MKAFILCTCRMLYLHVKKHVIVCICLIGHKYSVLIKQSLYFN